MTPPSTATTDRARQRAEAKAAESPAASTAVATRTPLQVAGDLLNRQKSAFAKALPAHLSPEKFTRSSLTAVRLNPKLALATQESFLGALMVCAQLGLEPNDPRGLAYLTGPFRNNKTGKDEVVLVIGYKGLIDLARRSGEISSIGARCVYEGDDFEYEYGLDERLVHKPDPDGPRDDNSVRFVYAVAKYKDGGNNFIVLTRNQVEAFRARSKAKDNGPWKTDWAAMAMKTAVRRLQPFLPLSVESATAIAVDEKTVRVPITLAPDEDVMDVASWEDDDLEPESEPVADPPKDEPVEPDAPTEPPDEDSQPDPPAEVAFSCDQGHDFKGRPDQVGEPCPECGDALLVKAAATGRS